MPAEAAPARYIRPGLLGATPNGIIAVSFAPQHIGSLVVQTAPSAEFWLLPRSVPNIRAQAARLLRNLRKSGLGIILRRHKYQLSAPAGSVALKRTETLGLPVDAVHDRAGVTALVETRFRNGDGLLVTFVNPHSWAVAKSQPQFRQQLERFDLVLPDGIGMSKAVQWLHGLSATRISFDMTSLAPDILSLAAQQGRDVVLVGGPPGCAERAAVQLQTVFAGLRIAATFDGYGDVADRVTQIAALQPDIVVCGMGAERQEAMLLALARTGWNGCGFTCGGFLDQLSERAFYYPGWVDRHHLRWAYRLAKEPRRLWRRYLLIYPAFMAAMAGEFLSGRIHRAGSAVLRQSKAGDTRNLAERIQNAESIDGGLEIDSRS